MKTSNFPLFCLLLFFHNLSAQFHSIEFNLDSVICQETGASYFSFDNWILYQTDSDELNGLRTDYCTEIDLGYIANIGEMVSQKPIFIETINPLGLEAIGNRMYLLEAFFGSNSELFCNCNNCSNDICSEVILIFEGSSNNETYFDTIRVDEALTFSINQISFGSCFLSPDLEELLLQKVIIKINTEEIEEDTELYFTSRISISTLFEGGEYSLFENKTIPNTLSGGIAYNVPASFFGKGGSFFQMVGVVDPRPYEEELQSNYFYDIKPEDNNEQKIINIINEQGSRLYFQKNAQLRGALVNLPNNDTLRHKLNHIVNGAFLCLTIFVDIVIGGDDELRFVSGGINFSHKSACIQFRDNGKLVVAPNAVLNYGQQGKGVLALRHKSPIVLEEEASLNLDCEILLNSDESIDIHLKKGRTLAFTSNCRIKSFNPNTKINIFLEGGDLMINHLDEESAKFINIIYPKNLQGDDQALLCYPNPCSNFLSIVSEQYLEDHEISIYNTEGVLIKTETLQNGFVNKVDVSTLANGIYFITSKIGLPQRIAVIN